jgi:hypothetical protein
MNKHLLVQEKSTRLQADFKMRIAQNRNWSSGELDDLYHVLSLFADIFGGSKNLTRQIGEVLIERINTGTKLGLAYKSRIQLSVKSQPSAWSVLHELAHVWDAKYDWNLSVELEKHTGGFTDKKLSIAKRSIPAEWDAGAAGAENKPGLYGRKPGVNKDGYFYGDKPSGSDWNFNRKEDFAESVVMYCGWGRENILSRKAHGRIERYLLPNGTKDPVYGIVDNWSDYAPYFYPEGGDYTKAKRWQFIDDLIRNNIKLEK